MLEALHEIFPDAPIYTAYLDLNGLGPHKDRVSPPAGGWNIKTSWMQLFPRKLLSPFRIFAPSVFRGFDLSDYDLVVSSCNTYFAKNVKTGPKTLHLSYIHTPPRYLYGYTTSFNYKKHFLTRVFGELANHFLRIYDFQASQKPDILIANSKEVQGRIKKFYRRDSIVVYPPVESTRYQAPSTKKDYFISVNRLVRGKGTEVTVAACTNLDMPLKVLGAGPEHDRLKRIAGKSIEFLGEVSDEEKGRLLAGAKALIVASEDEDFGITAVEAQAAGIPVIAIKQGGYLETVIPSKTGVFFEPSAKPAKYNIYVNQQTVSNLMRVLRNFDGSKFKAEDLQKNAEKFSKDRFKKEILELVEKNLRAD